MVSSSTADQPQASPDPGSYTEAVRHLLRVELLKGPCLASTVARRFSLGRRALHRRLRAERSSFRQITNEVRVEIACHLLAKTNIVCNQIARILNHADPSAFTRGFREWTGQSPSAWRSSHRR